MSYQTQSQKMEHGSVEHYIIRRDEQPLSQAEVLRLWQEDERFQGYFIDLLAGAPFAAYFWEMPPLTRDTLDQAFEFVLVDSPRLASVAADYRAFSRYFSTAAHDAVVGFDNLGRDAYLIVPSPPEGAASYAHLAAFSRSAPLAAQQAFWRRIGNEVEAHLEDRPLWVSTSGLGVYWLHVRLDQRPKYYTWQPYASPGYSRSRADTIHYA